MSQSNFQPRSWRLKTMDKEVYKLTTDQVDKMLEAQASGVTLIRIGGVVINSNSISSLYHIKERAFTDKTDTILSSHKFVLDKYKELLSMTPEERVTHFDKSESQGLLKPGGSGEHEDLLPDNDKLRLARPETKELGKTVKQGS